VLSRISQVIEHRLVVSEIPRQMRVPVIYNGRVRFHVDNEFKVTMTLMGDNALVPWRLLDVTILVEDPEIGEGKSLVHPLQLNYVHQLVQSRLCESEQPLVDLYCCLHSFCLSLQLEVLQTQAYRLVQQRFGDNPVAGEFTFRARVWTSRTGVTRHVVKASTAFT
jgi:mediator of RNA polymerase II transcription subunit 14